MKLLAAIAALSLLSTPIAFASDDAPFMSAHPGYAAAKANLETLTSYSGGACSPAKDAWGHVIVHSDGLDTCGNVHRRGR